MKKVRPKKNIRQLFLTTQPYRSLVLFLIPTILLLVLLIVGFLLEGSQQYSLLADAFGYGHLNFLQPIGGAGQDPVIYHGKIYWSEGPFPALPLLPFVALFHQFHHFFYQGYLKWFFVLGVWFFVYRLAQRLKYSDEDSITLAFGFTLGSVFIGVASVSASWYYAQVVTTFLLFWSLYEYFSLRRWWLIGIICACIFMTRATAIPVILFFGLELLYGLRKGKRLKPILQLGLPLACAIGLIGLYNFLRFDSPFNGGYGAQKLFAASIESESLGIFSPIHIPTNFFSAVLRMPVAIPRDTSSWSLQFPYIENNEYGMSIFFTSPYLLYLFLNSWKLYDRQQKHLLLAIALSALLVFSYFGVGIVQFGYRYSLDFLPELFVLFMLVYRKHHDRITLGMRSLLLGSGIVNFILIWWYFI